jgi:hypothetical protein
MKFRPGILLSFFYVLPILAVLTAGVQNAVGQQAEEKIVLELFRLRNEHKADSAERYYADTVKVYMKYLRNVPKAAVTRSDKQFWKQHPRNKFEIIRPVQVKLSASGATVIIYGKEYLDGIGFKYEKIEIRLNRDRKIYYYRAYNWNGGGRV